MLRCFASISFCRLARYSSVYFSGSHGRVQRLDQLLRHLQLGVAQLRFGEVERRGRHQLLAKAHRRQHQRVLDRLDGGQVRLVAHHELGDADPARLPQRLAQQGVGGLASRRWQQVVGLVEIAVIDLVGRHEIEQVDAAVALDGGSREVLRREDDVAPLLVFVALDQVLGRHDLAVVLGHLLEADARLVRLAQEVEVRPEVLDRAVDLDRDADQAEAERAFPEWACHGRKTCTGSAAPAARCAAAQRSARDSRSSQRA